MLNMRKRKFSRKERGAKHIARAAWLFGSPGLAVQIFFGWYPLIVAFIICFQKFSVFGASTFIGLENFRYFMDDPLFYTSLRNTFLYAALSIALVFLLPIFVAILLMEMRKGTIRIMMLLWFIPYGTMAGLVIWRWFYQPQYGLFNAILVNCGLPPLMWLEDKRLAMLCLVLPGLIMYGPGLIYIATLQNIPSELYEAAELEGARIGQKIWHISLPRLRPIITMMLILAAINNLQVFQQPFVMTGGGPNFATYSIVMYIFDCAFKNLEFGKATALAVMLFFIIMALVILQRKYVKENPDI